MQLDRLALHLRRRSPMEAIDLGCAMARTWWRPLLAAWLPLYLGVSVIVHLAFYGNYVVAILVLWWLKPIFDRAALEVLGRAVFGEQPSMREALKGVMKSPALLASLTLYRFDLARSFNLPIWHLERLRGPAAARRARALHGRSRRHAVWATIVFLHFELVMMLGLYAAIDLFTPVPYGNEFGLKTLFGPDEALWHQWIYSAFYALTVTVLEPFYVAAGFALYLNRRTQLEAWDVELALRRFARRESARPRSASAAALAAAVMLAVSLALQPFDSVHAAQREAPDPRVTIQQVLAEPEFDQYAQVKRLRYVGRGWGGESASPSRERSTSLAQGPGLFAEIARLLMWLGAGLLVAAALYYARRFSPNWGMAPRVRRAPPSAIFGLEITPESLPADVAGAALAAFDEGNVRGGLSLLYRGALSVLFHGEGLEVSAGDTEGDCVRRVAASDDPRRARYFSDLVDAWQSTAYAGRLPAGDVLRALCAAWRVHFAAAVDS